MVYVVSVILPVRLVLEQPLTVLPVTIPLPLIHTSTTILVFLTVLRDCMRMEAQPAASHAQGNARPAQPPQFVLPAAQTVQKHTTTTIVQVALKAARTGPSF